MEKYINGYSASPEGRVYGKDGSRLKLIQKRNGYLYFSMCVAGKVHQTAVHRFMWEYFVGDIPSGYHVDHVDGLKSNNALSNLQLLLPRDNARKSARLLDVKLAEEIRQRRLSGETGANLSREYGVSEQLICDLYKGRRWKS